MRGNSVRSLYTAANKDLYRGVYDRMYIIVYYTTESTGHAVVPNIIYIRGKLSARVQFR